MRAPPQSSADRRVAPRTADASVGTPTPSDWTRFDATTSLRALRGNQHDTRTRELRKLPLRLWHASKEEMARVLRAATISQDILDLIPSVVKCRKWLPPAHQTIPILRLSTRFNQHVECDILFYKDRMVLHLICCASRWHNGQDITDRHDSTLHAAVDRSWSQLFGAMERFIVEGEGGMGNSKHFTEELKRRGVTVDIRAPRQHARFIERRGAILRHAMHTAEDQM